MNLPNAIDPARFAREIEIGWFLCLLLAEERDTEKKRDAGVFDLNARMSLLTVLLANMPRTIL
ncbi:hypothetical protein BJV74DRAFT_826605 [Russula compacta]|nr:hypothetical protein BJV74DRAFT_826605 [Russula compacta]